MTYSAGSPIQASDYNTFSTAALSMNQIFADLYPGATTLPNAGYGYGQTPALTPVVGDNTSPPADIVTAAQWTALFQTIRKSGTHQGTAVVPPLPPAVAVPGQLDADGNPIIGATITAYNTPALAGIITNLGANKFNLAPMQTSLIPGTNFSNPAPWTSSLVYTCQVNFGTWNNARYYFNSGSSISITGVYNPAPSADELAWQSMFATDFPVNMNWQRTLQTAGSNSVVNPAGFYLNGLFPGLTASYQNIYQNYVNSAPYSATNYVRIEAKLNAVAGTNGLIDFRISMVDVDAYPTVKAAGRMTFTFNRIQSAGAIAYPGSYSFTSGGFVAV